MKLHQYAVYRMNDSAKMRRLRFHDYEKLGENKNMIRSDNYNQICLAHAYPEDNIEKIYRRLREQIPKQSHGSRLNTGDVIVYNADGVANAFFANASSVIKIPGFLVTHSDGTNINIDTMAVEIKGCKGTWSSIDSIAVDGKFYYLMESDEVGNKAAAIVVSAIGEVVISACSDGFEKAIINQIREYEKTPISESNSVVKVEASTHWVEQKQESAAQVSANGNRPSVLARLKQKQLEIAQKKRAKMPKMERTK